MAAESASAPVDILDILLAAPPETDLPECTELDRLLRRCAAPQAAPPPVASPPSAAPGPVRLEPERTGGGARKKTKIKTTQYLAPDTNARLSRVRDALAASHPAGQTGRPGRVSKSRIVDAALRQALEEFEAKGPDSRLARALEPAADTA